MRACLLIVLIGLIAGCAKSAAPSKLDAFFVDWLKAHGETNVVVGAQGVGLAGNATRLKAALYGSKKSDKGGYTVETEFRVRLPSGVEIVEYVAGMGGSEEEAVNDSLLNFTLTTFHVLYKGFLNDADPHQKVETVAIGGQPRQLILGDIYLRGQESKQPLDLNAMREPIRKALVGLALSGQPHWIKIVYSQVNEKPLTVAVTLDNGDQEALTEAIKRLPWPKRAEFYMAKQFIVVK
jgi:hypothetical protein